MRYRGRITVRIARMNGVKGVRNACGEGAIEEGAMFVLIRTFQKVWRLQESGIVMNYQSLARYG